MKNMKKLKTTPRGRVTTELAYRHFGRNIIGSNAAEPTLFG